MPLPNTSTSRCFFSPSRHGCWCPMCPFRGVLFKQSCIQNKLHSIYYSTCTVKSPTPLTPPTCVSFKLFNQLRVYVLYVKLSLRHLRPVYSFKLQWIHSRHTFVRGIPLCTCPRRQDWWPVVTPDAAVPHLDGCLGSFGCLDSDLHFVCLVRAIARVWTVKITITIC